MMCCPAVDPRGGGEDGHVAEEPYTNTYAAWQPEGHEANELSPMCRPAAQRSDVEVELGLAYATRQRAQTS